MGGIKLTHKCNLSCIHCPFWQRETNSLSFSQAVSTMETLNQLGVRIIIFEGGEPFLWKDGEYGLKDVVAEAKKLFFRVGVTTNGTFPIDINSDMVWVSVDGLQDTHNQIRGGDFKKVLSNLKTSIHPRIYAHTTINSLNWEEIPAVVDFISPFVEGITVQFHYPYEEEQDELFLPFSKRRSVLNQLIQMKKEGFPLANSYACLEALKDNEWSCYPWMIASVEPNGEIHQGCYVQNRGNINCGQCGFSAHTELSLAYQGGLQSILAGDKIFHLRGGS
ncbi:DUF3463 domain-containing protein [Candidatus Bipolaricaulota bacterium]|nr:DUF3463 domain-containing protein [Candidatus Bipolaricaulota bacterium]